MSIIGIVSEFNPFHNGHKYLIDSVKKQGDTVVCVMSGNYVQRGEPAIFSKDVRVKSALMNGVDIVLELPFIYATASAEYFAKNAVRILDSFGCDKIVFGTENTTVNQLNCVADILLDKAFDENVKKHLESGISYPSARELSLKEYCDIEISTPNNILAVEYLKALKELKSTIEPIAVNRIGAGYNDNCAVDNIASATHIRHLINNDEDFKKYVPQNTYELYKNIIEKGNILSVDKYNTTVLGILRTKIYDEPNYVCNMSEGLENRIIDAVKCSVSLEEIYEKAKTKRYTHSRIRRAVLSLAFGVSNDCLNIPVPYCRLLGFKKSSMEVLGALASKCKLPYVVTFNDLLRLNNENVMKIFGFENSTSDIYSLVTERPDVCSKEMTFSPIKVQ